MYLYKSLIPGHKPPEITSPTRVLLRLARNLLHIPRFTQPRHVGCDIQHGGKPLKHHWQTKPKKHEGSLKTCFVRDIFTSTYDVHPVTALWAAIAGSLIHMSHDSVTSHIMVTQKIISLHRCHVKQ